MKGVEPCPYCGGEIEMVKLGRTQQEKKDRKPRPYRIECLVCRRLVARGQGFPIESTEKAKKRIRDYEKYIESKFTPSGFGHKKGGGTSRYKT